MKASLFAFVLVLAGGTTLVLAAPDAPVLIQMSPELTQKLSSHAILSVHEIAALARAGYPEAKLRAHLRASRAIYRLSAENITELQAGGVGNETIDEMLGRAYAATAVRRRVYYPAGRFYYGDSFWSGGYWGFGLHGSGGHGFHGGHGHH